MGTYIRFKNIPENETSGVFDGDLGKIREEPGVCCFDCVKKGEFYKIILPSFSTGPLYDIQRFIYDLESKDSVPIYLIEAEEVGTGTYGEPAVKNVKILCELEYVELEIPCPKLKLDRTNVQLRKKELLSVTL